MNMEQLISLAQRYRWQFRYLLYLCSCLLYTSGLLLNIFKSSIAIQFSSIEGYLLTAGNFALTVGLCAVVIRLLNQNTVLKKVLNIR